MLSYLQKFKNLPQDIKDKVSSSEMMDIIHEMESKYKVDLAKVVMRVMVKEINFDDLEEYFVFEDNMEKATAHELTEKLKTRVFSSVANYLDYVRRENLGLDAEVKNNQQSVVLSPATGPNFFFYPEDEDEADKYSRKIKGLDRREEMNIRLDSQIERILSEVLISFSSVDLTRRFKQILKTYLRGIRDRMETRETLTRAIESGGLNIDHELVDKILRIADKIREQEKKYELSFKPLSPISLPEDMVKSFPKEKTVDSGGNQAMGEKEPQEQKDSDSLAKPMASHRDVAYDFRKLMQKEKEDKIKKDEQEQKKKGTETTTKKEEEKKEMVIDLSSKSKESFENKEEEKKKQADRKKQTENDHILSSSFARAQAKLRAGEDKVKIEDVKHIPKLSGPIDELKKMDLTNFRRISDNPKQAALKIKEMIRIMEDEGYGKKLEAVKAWRSSPLNKLYLSLGAESIRKGRSIDDTIAAKGVKALKKEEFDVIMDLNKDLRY